MNHGANAREETSMPETTEPDPSLPLRERLEAMRDSLIADLAQQQYIDGGRLQLLGTVGSALRALEDAKEDQC